MKSNINTLQILGLSQKLTFTIIGPFLVANMDTEEDSIFESLPVGEHGMEELLAGQTTESHQHDFPSFYKSSDLDVECEGERFSLPDRALTLVLPGISHSWIPKKSGGLVGSVDSRHEKQILRKVA